MDHPGDAAEFLEFVESVLCEEDVDELQTLDRFAPALLNLLSFKASNAESRAKVQSRHLQTPLGPVTLDEDPDVRQVLLLADELQLDEVSALLYVLAAQKQSGEVSAAAAAGVFFDERLAMVQALTLLLHTQVMSAAAVQPETYNAVASFNALLLSQTTANGGTTLVQRLAELIQSEALFNREGSQLVVVDAYGRLVDRNDAVQREQAALCNCLLYACCIKQRLAPVDLSRLLDLLHHLSLRARAAGGENLAAQHQASMVLLSVLLGVLPLEDAEGEDADADTRALRALAHSELGAKVAALPASEDPYAAVVKMAWGVLLLCSGEESATQEGVDAVAAGIDAGALGFVRSGMAESVPMADESEDTRLTAASVVNQLLMLFVEVAQEALVELRQRSRGGADEEIEAAARAARGEGGGPERALMVVDHRGTPLPSAPLPPDTFATLLSTLAAVLRIHPALFLDDARRCSQLPDLMGSVRSSQEDTNVPSVLLAYLEVLTALAATQAGARGVYQELRPGHAADAISWRRFFGVLHDVIRLYNPPEVDGQAGGQGRISNVVLSSTDTKAICAMAALFERVMLEGSPEEVGAWVRQLDSDAGVAPCWEVLFQAMCCPVPQELKAALDGAIGALARRPDLAAALWERLLAAVVVQPAGGAGASDSSTTGVARYDLSYQLNEIEARAEDYVEAVAFVRLLNGLWRAGGSGLSDDGRPVAHLTRFVQEELLGTALQRSYRDDVQRWDLVAVALEHCELCLGALQVPPAALAADAVSPSAAKPPGLEVLLDLLGEGAAMRAALGVLSRGVDRLAHERHTAAFGAAQEGAVLAALRLLRCGFEHDVDFVGATRRAHKRASYQTLDAVLRHDRTRVPLLLEYVRYPHNPAVQAEALRVGTALATRDPALVKLLLSMPADAGAPIAERLQDGFAACMHDSLLVPPELLGVLSEGGDGHEEDPRAALLLDLLLACLNLPTPNLTQLLCGYDVGSGMSPLALLDPRALHTPLRVALEALGQRRLAARRPRLYEQCLELVYELAEAPDSGPATLDLLRGYHSTLTPLLGTVACSPLPPPGPARASSLHQRAWLLHLLTLELHRADAALAPHRDSLTALLASLFASGDDGINGGAPGGRGCMIDLLGIAVGNAPAEPQLGEGASAEVRRMMSALEVEALLSSPLASGAGGVRIVGSRGDALIDVEVLKDELLARYTEVAALNDAPSEALREAARATLQYAGEYNAYAEQLGGQAALLAAWQALLTVAFTRRFELVAAVVGGAGQPTDPVLGMAEDCLRALSYLLSSSGAALAPPVCGALQALMAQLQEQALAAATVDPVGGMPLPSRCHGLLQALLGVIWEGRGQEAVRLPLYGCLVSYLAMCRGPALLQAPPAVVGALLQGMRDGGAAAAEQLDALQVALEDGNVAALHSNLRLLELLVADATAPNPATATCALTALAALMAADPTTTTAMATHRSGLTSRLLADLQGQPAAALVQNAPATQATVLVAESQLTLLLRLALAGPPAQQAASAEQLFALQALPRLAHCRALDLQPEEPGFMSVAGGSLRQRLHAVVTPALRLALAITTALPNSAAVREQAAKFVEEHHRSLGRVLRDAASSGVRGWEPSDAELEEGTAVVQLLAELAPHRELLSPPQPPQLQEAVYRAASRFLCPDARSQSPLVARVHAAKEAGRLTPREQRTCDKVLSLRCALAAYLRALSADGQAPTFFRCAAYPATSELPGLAPTLFLIKDALLQAVELDLPEALGELSALLEALRCGDLAAAANLVDGRVLGTPDKLITNTVAASSSLVVRAAARRHVEVSKLLFLIEHLLAILYQQLRLCTPGVGDGMALEPSALEVLGSEKDLDQLRRLTKPAIGALERMLARGALPGDCSSLDLLVRRTKEQLMPL